MSKDKGKLEPQCPPVIIRTSEGLRDALFDELDLLRQDKSNSHRAMAVAKLATQIINSVRLEIEYMLASRKDHTPGGDNMTKRRIITLGKQP